MKMMILSTGKHLVINEVVKEDHYHLSMYNIEYMRQIKRVFKRNTNLSDSDIEDLRLRDIISIHQKIKGKYSV